MKFKTLNSFALLIIAVLFLFFWKEQGFYWSLLALAVAYLAILSFGVFNLSANFFAPAITQGDSKMIYLTYDDGPHKELTPLVLDYLKEEEINATFFVIGKNAAEHDALMRRIVDERHYIGNHSHTHHPLFQMWSTKRVTEDLENTMAIISQYQHPASKAFRPPIGIMNPNIAKAALKLRYPIVGWNNRTFDTATKDVEVTWKRTKRNLERGKTLILMHDTIPQSLELTKRIVKWGKEKGMEFATVEHLIS